MRSTSRIEFFLFFLAAALILVGSFRMRVYYRVTTVETTVVPPAADLPDWVRWAGYSHRRGDHAVALTQARIDRLVRERPELADRVWTMRTRRNGRPHWTEFRYEPRSSE